jgi:3-mercaptopyruvate sulfurtransferase SseA
MEPTVIDVRALPQYRQGHIPGAQSWELRPRNGGEVHAHLLPQHGHPHGLVIYCDCPNEISAARLARQLQRAGFANVRPLVGGLKAWQAAGFEVEAAPLPVAAGADEGPAPSVP